MGDSQGALRKRVTPGPWLASGGQTQHTTEARFPPVHIDVLSSTGLGIVGKGGANSFLLFLWVTACSGSSTVGKEAGLMVLIWGNL